MTNLLTMDLSRWLRPVLLVALVGSVGTGCGVKGSQSPPPATAARPVRFVDATDASGIRFVHHTGAFGRYWMPETMGSGCALFDYDDDGDLDAFFVNCRDWPGHGPGNQTLALYRNRGDGTFEEATRAAGLAVSIYGMGCAVGDYDNDGDDDLYVTGLEHALLFRNNGNGTFTEVGRQAGVRSPGWSTSAAWLDYDKDGYLDLFVVHYVVWNPQIQEKLVEYIQDQRTYNTPQPFQGETNRLYRNLGNGGFADVTEPCGIYHPTGKGLGVAVCDVDGDGWQDLAVAHDTQPNQLLINTPDPQAPGGRRFVDRATSAGIAVSPEGNARGAMGIDAAPIHETNEESLVIGNFSNEQLSLYRNDGKGIFFTDLASRSEVGIASQTALAFAVFFFDCDNDGLNDIFVATGHVKPQIQLVDSTVTYRQRQLLFLNRGGGNFREIGREAGFVDEMVARGAAYGDVDQDGDLDILLTLNGGPARLYRNETGGRSLIVRLVGQKSNRNGYGARVTATIGGRPYVRHVRSGLSYCSHADAMAHFGLGGAEGVEKLVVEWPAGTRQEFGPIAGGRTIVITEGETQFRELPSRTP